MVYRLKAVAIAAICVPMMCSAQTVAKYKGNAKAAVSYTFDDGLVSHYTEVLPHLDSLGIKGTFWLIGHAIDTNKKMRDVPVMTWDEAKIMAEHGQELASHSFTHSNFKKMTFEEIKAQIEDNDSAVFEHTGVHPTSFCFPGNARTDSILEYVKSLPQVKAVRTYQKAVGGSQCGDSARIDAWLQKYIDSGGWAVGMTHGIGAGYDCYQNPAVLWGHLKRAKALADKGLIWIGTFGEVSAYLNGTSEYVTYIIDGSKSSKVSGSNAKPKSVKQKGKKLNVYQSWDGKWCVDALRGEKLKIKY